MGWAATAHVSLGQLVGHAHLGVHRDSVNFPISIFLDLQIPHNDYTLFRKINVCHRAMEYNLATNGAEHGCVFDPRGVRRAEREGVVRDRGGP